MSGSSPSTAGHSAEATGPIVGADVDPAAVQRALARSGVIGLLGVEVLELSTERVVLSLPVGPKTHQPVGILHGGVSASSPSQPPASAPPSPSRRATTPWGSRSTPVTCAR